MQPITDTAILEGYLRRDAALHAYALGDLDPFFRPYTTWFADDPRNPAALVLRYKPGNASPVYHALCSPKYITNHAALFCKLATTLPDSFEIHATPGVLAEAPSLFSRAPEARNFQIDRRELHCKMIWRGKPGAASVDEAGDFTTSAARQTERTEIESFFAEAYPENWFDPRMLGTDAYLLARAQDDTIAGVAGVHVYSQAYRVAALGNIATHPQYRRRGIANSLTGRLCALLLARGIETITLNVKAANAAAIACYESLGFERFAQYEELSISRVNGNLQKS